MNECFNESSECMYRQQQKTIYVHSQLDRLMDYKYIAHLTTLRGTCVGALALAQKKHKWVSSKSYQVIRSTVCTSDRHIAWSGQGIYHGMVSFRIL